MARPKKQTVEYFPHYTGASDGKTLYILQSRFHNDGYAFWFKLLELLGSTEGHYYSFKNPAEWQFLLAKTGVSAEVCQQILELLADVEAIDKELYQVKVVWCQKFVDNLAEVYRKRTVTFPSRPMVSAGKTVVSVTEIGVSGVSNPQMKVNEMKVNEMKGDTPLNPPTVCPSLESVINAYQDNILVGGTVTEQMEAELKGACRRYTPAWVADAIKEALLQNEPTWRYIMGILQNWSLEGHCKATRE